MKTNLGTKNTFFILGLPRGGTTIVARVFDSLEDGFCLGEPHWLYENLGSAEQALGKVPGPAPTTRDAILPWIKREVQDEGWMLGGYKETLFRLHRGIYTLAEEHAERVAFFVIVFRSPRQVLASQHAHGYVEEMSGVDDYRFLEALANRDNGIGLCFERFVENPLGYLNSRLPFRIDGSLALQPTNHAYGDPRANRSRFIRPPEPRRPDPAPKEAMQIWRRWSQ